MNTSEEQAPSPGQQDLDKLRRQAERRRVTTEALVNKTPEEIQRLVEELQVHQIELEMQYEELRLAQDKAERLGARFVDLYDFAPVGYCTLDAQGLVQEANLRAAQLLGTVRGHLMGRRFAMFVALGHREEFHRFLEHALHSPERSTCELRLQQDTSTGRPLYAQFEALRTDEEPAQVRVAMIDVTEQRQITDELAASEDKFRTLFEQSADAAVLVQDLHYIDCNQAAVRLLNATDKSQIIGQPVMLLTPEHQPDGRESRQLLHQLVQRAEQQGSHQFEWERRKFTGEVMCLEVTITPLSLSGQRIIHATWRDITDRKLGEERLRDSEDRLRSALTSAKLGVVSWNPGTEEAYLDERALAIVGLPPDSVPTVAELRTLLHPTDQPTLNEAVEAVRHQGGPLDTEFCIRRPDGQERTLRISGQLAADAQGRPVRLTGVIRDVTERRRDRRRLTESEERLRLALKASGAGVWVTELATDELQWDERAQFIYGHPFDDNPVPAAAFRQAVHPDDRERVAAALQASLDQHSIFEVEHRVLWPDGTVRHVACTGQAVYDARRQPLRFVGLIRDVTESLLAQKELGYQTRLMDRVVHNTPVVLTRIGRDGTLLEVIGAGLTRLGVADNALRGLNVFQSWPVLTEHVQQLLASQEVRFLSVPPNRGGQQVYFQNYGFFDEERQCGILFAIDVTETQEANLRLRAEKDFSRNLLDTSMDGIVALDTELRVTTLNRAASQTFGLQEQRVVGEQLFGVVPELDLPQYRLMLAQVLAGTPLQQYDLPFHGRFFDAYFAPLRNAGGSISGVLAVIRDVTERNHLAALATTAQLQQQKEVLSAILHTQEDERKRIAEGLHNGVGQLLYATKLHLEHKPLNEEHRLAAINVLNEAIRSTRSISFELTPNILEDFGLKTALEELTKRIPAQKLQVHMTVSKLPDTLPRVLETAVYRIVQELLNNVMKHAAAREVFVYVETAGPRLLVTVEDDGRGFEVEREAAQRAGIGLMGIRNRVSLLGGQLIIRSQPGLGTSISIELPIGSEAARSEG